MEVSGLESRYQLINLNLLITDINLISLFGSILIKFTKFYQIEQDVFVHLFLLLSIEIKLWKETIKEIKIAKILMEKKNSPKQSKSAASTEAVTKRACSRLLVSYNLFICTIFGSPKSYQPVNRKSAPLDETFLIFPLR